MTSWLDKAVAIASPLSSLSSLPDNQGELVQAGQAALASRQGYDFVGALVQAGQARAKTGPGRPKGSKTAADKAKGGVNYNGHHGRRGWNSTASKGMKRPRTGSGQ